MSIDPKILKRMQAEEAFLQSQTHSLRRVKMDKGRNWIVRFLPVKLGPDGLWFARIAKHWLNRVPIVCPRNTMEDYGGSLEAHCPVCVMADELNGSPDQTISTLGYDARGNPQFLTYCIVLEKDGVAQPWSEVLNPYEFTMTRATWDELRAFYQAGGRKHKNSVLDYEFGNEFSVSRGQKGYRLDKLDACPIFDIEALGEAKYKDYIAKIEGAIKSPKVTIPTTEQLEVFAAKLQEIANRGSGASDDDGPRRGRSRRSLEEDDDADAAPRSRRPAPAPEEEDNLPYDTPPARPPAARAAAAPVRRSAPEPEDAESRRRMAPVDEARRRREPEPEPESEAPARRRVTEESEQPVRRSARQADPAPAEADDPAPADIEERPTATLPSTQRRVLEPTARRQAARAEAAASAPQPEAEDEDPLPEDDRDPVPPAARAGEDDDAPPPVARRGQQGSDIKSRLSEQLRKLPSGA